jgi:hypothetical protein
MTCRADALARQKWHTKLTEIVREPEMAQYAQHSSRAAGWQKSVPTLGTKRTSDYHTLYGTLSCIWRATPIKGEQFLQFIVIRYETWVNHTIFETNGVTLNIFTGGDDSSPPVKIFKVTPLVRNIMTTALRDHKGLLLAYFLDRDDTVKSYCGTTERLRHAINHKTPGSLIQTLSLRKTTPGPTTQNAHVTGYGARRYSWEIMNLPPCSCSLALVIYASLDPLQTTWSTNNLEQTMTWSKLSPPDYRQFTLISFTTGSKPWGSQWDNGLNIWVPT